MNKFFLGSLLVFATTFSKAQSDTTQLRSIFKMVQKEYAPDKRVIYFNLQFKGDTVLAESTSSEVLRVWGEQSKHITGIHEHSLLPTKNLKGFEYGLANVSVSNNRAFPYHAAEMYTQMLLGMPVQVLKKQGGFYLVRTPDNYLSWTDGTAVTLLDKSGIEAWKKAKRIIFAEDFGHAFSQPDTHSDRVSDLVKGNILVVTGKVKDFYKVTFPDKREAFVKKNEVQLFDDWMKRPNPTADAILTSAKTLIGTPYLWGGTSIKGVDCSGFTKTSYFLNGIIIPRDASQQALVGEAVDVLENDSISVEKCLKNLQPGDLLFFSAAKLRGIKEGRITHTALYIGEGKFIQSAGMVRINSLLPNAPDYDSHEAKSLVSARRFLNHIGNKEITRVNQQGWYTQ
ncbi:NlpC/P60 family protein [Pedobacter sp. MW01-1-1]|uniref:NlpC/P60 family protein n=1 Tax=Pedobacter sp. MW01-1-1 TaxID=3383027 RepID=UPI003FF0759C